MQVDGGEADMAVDLAAGELLVVMPNGWQSEAACVGAKSCWTRLNANGPT